MKAAIAVLTLAGLSGSLAVAMPKGDKTAQSDTDTKASGKKTKKHNKKKGDTTTSTSTTSPTQ